MVFQRLRSAVSVIACLTLVLQGCGGGGSGTSGETQASLPAGDSELTVSGDIYGVNTASSNVSAPFLSGAKGLLSDEDLCKPTLPVCYAHMLELVTVVVIPALCLFSQPCQATLQTDDEQEEQEEEEEEEELQVGKIFVRQAQTDEDGHFDLNLKGAGRALDDGGMLFIFGQLGEQKAMWLDGGEEEADENGNAEIEMGDVDMESTIAAESFQDFVQADLEKYEELGGNLDDFSTDYDVSCLLKLQEEQYGQTLDGEGTGVAASLTIIQILTAAAMIANDPAAFGYDSMTDLTAAISDGSLTAEALEALANAAQANVLGGNAQGLIDSYAFATQDNKVLTGVYASSFATDAGDDDPCDKMDADAEVLAETVSVALNYDDMTSLVSTFDDAGAVTGLFDYMERYSDGNGNYDFDGDEGICADCPVWNPAVTSGFFDAYQEVHGEFTDFSNYVGEFAEMSSFIPESTSEVFDYGDWATAMAGQYLNDPETFDPSAASGFWAVQVESGFDFDDGTVSISTFDYDGVYETMGTAYASTYSSCYADPAACASSFDSSQIQIAGVTYQDYSTASACGDGTCDAGESSSCYADCGYSATTAASSYYSADCGDGTCEGYESYSCPSDCAAEDAGASDSPGTDGTSDASDTAGTSDASGTSGTSDASGTAGTTSGTYSTYCGDGTCNGSETSSICPSDCYSTSGTSGTYTYCGDGTCNGSETVTSCYSDCYSATGTSGETDSVVCGDGMCTGYETIYTCYADCYSGSYGGSSAYCGDNVCNNGETISTCYVDCD